MSDQATLFGRAGRALGVNVLSTLVGRLGTMVIGIALARLLGPEEFGTFAVATLASLAILSFNELGVSLAIVRWPGEPREIAPTVATMSTVSSGVLALATVALAPVFCDVLGAPDATNVVRLLAVSILLDGVVATPAALLQREFKAGRRLVIDQTVTWVGTLVSIALAVAGLGAMSLAVGRITGALVGAVMFIHAKPVRFGFDREVARRLLHFGIPLAGSSVVVFVVKYADQFVVGSVLGPVALGFYVLAFNLSSWPVTVLSQPVRQVSPAAFARLQADPPALRSAFVASVGLLAALTMPICLVLSGAAEPIISFVYGASWTPAAAALAWLGLFACLRIMFELIYDYFVVVGSTRVVFTVQVIWSVVLIPALVVATTVAGIAGAAFANFAVAMAVVLPIYVVELHKAHVPWLSLVKGVAVPAAAGAGVAAVSFVAAQTVNIDLVALTIAGVAVLAALALEASRIRASVQRLRTATLTAAT